MNENLRTARRRRARRRGAVLVAGTALVAAIAAAWTIPGGAAKTQNGPPEWVWANGAVPGERAAAGREVRAALELSRGEGVADESVRRVISARLGGEGFTLLAGRGATGRVCFTAITGAFTRGFSCLNALADEHALITYTASGGAELGTTDWSLVVGIARSDVARVLAVTRDGEAREVVLNRWRAFEVESASGSAPVVALRTYRADGSLIDETAVAA
jgi:hypothetical protein